MLLDSGAAVSVVSPDFVTDSDKIATKRAIKGISNSTCVSPAYMFTLEALGVKGRCLFISYSKLPHGSVLLGRDLGDVFMELLGKVLNSPKPVYMTTRARAKALEEERHIRAIKEAMDVQFPLIWMISLMMLLFMMLFLLNVLILRLLTIVTLVVMMLC